MAPPVSGSTPIAHPLGAAPAPELSSAGRSEREASQGSRGSASNRSFARALAPARDLGVRVVAAGAGARRQRQRRKGGEKKDAAAVDQCGAERRRAAARSAFMGSWAAAGAVAAVADAAPAAAAAAAISRKAAAGWVEEGVLLVSPRGIRKASGWHETSTGRSGGQDERNCSLIFRSFFY